MFGDWVKTAGGDEHLFDDDGSEQDDEQQGDPYEQNVKVGEEPNHDDGGKKDGKKRKKADDEGKKDGKKDDKQASGKDVALILSALMRDEGTTLEECIEEIHKCFPEDNAFTAYPGLFKVMIETLQDKLSDVPDTINEARLRKQ